MISRLENSFVSLLDSHIQQRRVEAPTGVPGQLSKAIGWTGGRDWQLREGDRGWGLLGDVLVDDGEDVVEGVAAAEVEEPRLRRLLVRVPIGRRHDLLLQTPDPLLSLQR